MYSHRQYVPNDYIILEEVLSLNTFNDATMWAKIAEKLGNLTRVARNVPSVKQRLDFLLVQCLWDDATNRRK